MQVENADTKNRILSLEVGSRDLGFAALETPAHLLEYGRRKHRVKTDELPDVVGRKISALLALHLPDIIAVRSRSVRTANAQRRIALILSVLRREARRRSIEFQTISRKAVRQFFARYQCTSKHQIATLVVRWFPELSWKLPPKRKAWKSEDHRMVIFDAMATALTFLNRSPPATQ